MDHFWRKHCLEAADALRFSPVLAHVLSRPLDIYLEIMVAMSIIHWTRLPTPPTMQVGWGAWLLIPEPVLQSSHHLSNLKQEPAEWDVG